MSNEEGEEVQGP